MASKHFTALGEQIDMAALAMKNASTVALGNARMNARGDIVGDGGIVLKTQEQIDDEWRRARETRESSVGYQDIKQPMSQSQPPGKKLTDDQDFDPSAPPGNTNADAIMGLVDKQTRRRKIVDAE